MRNSVEIIQKPGLSVRFCFLFSVVSDFAQFAFSVTNVGNSSSFNPKKQQT